MLNRKLAEGLSPRRVDFLRGVLHRALNQALRWSLVGRNVAGLARSPKQVRYEIRPLSPPEVGHLLEAVRGPLRVGAAQEELAGEVSLPGNRSSVHAQQTTSSYPQQAREPWLGLELAQELGSLGWGELVAAGDLLLQPLQQPLAHRLVPGRLLGVVADHEAVTLHHHFLDRRRAHPFVTASSQPPDGLL